MGIPTFLYKISEKDSRSVQDAEQQSPTSMALKIVLRFVVLILIVFLLMVCGSVSGVVLHFFSTSTQKLLHVIINMFKNMKFFKNFNSSEPYHVIRVVVWIGVLLLFMGLLFTNWNVFVLFITIAVFFMFKFAKNMDTDKGEKRSLLKFFYDTFNLINYSKYFLVFVVLSVYILIRYYLHLTTILQSDFTSNVQTEKGLYDQWVDIFYQTYQEYVHYFKVRGLDASGESTLLVGCKQTNGSWDEECLAEELLVARDNVLEQENFQTTVIERLHALVDTTPSIRKHFFPMFIPNVPIVTKNKYLVEKKKLHTFIVNIVRHYLLVQLHAQGKLNEQSKDIFHNTFQLPRLVTSLLHVEHESKYGNSTLYCSKTKASSNTIQSALWFFMGICIMNMFLCVPMMLLWNEQNQFTPKHILLFIVFIFFFVMYVYLGKVRAIFVQNNATSFYVQGMDTDHQVLPNKETYVCNRFPRNYNNKQRKVVLYDYLVLIIVAMVMNMYFLYQLNTQNTSNQDVKDYIPYIIIFYMHILLTFFAKTTF